ncbi:hypothetical protein ACLB2K_072203 [Fragaria x ananassa]
MGSDRVHSFGQTQIPPVTSHPIQDNHPVHINPPRESAQTQHAGSSESKPSSAIVFYINLGDYLVFNTENQTVIETQNATAYRLCTADDASDESTFVWGTTLWGRRPLWCRW